METVATRQKNRDALSMASLTVLSRMTPTRRKVDDQWGTYFRRWRARSRIRFSNLGHSLWGAAQVKRWLTLVGHLAHMHDTRIVKLEFRPLFSWGTHQSLVDGRGGEVTRFGIGLGDFAHAFGRRSRSRLAICGKVPCSSRSSRLGRSLVWAGARGARRREKVYDP